MSIQANELRIGNCLYNDDTDDIMVVSRIESKDYTKWNNNNEYNIIAFKIVTNDGYYEGDFRPIPLTEEWLLKFGFEYRGGHGYKSPMGENFYFSIGNGFIHEMYRHTNFKGVKYVHQLQNLYFVLTGEELTIKQ